MGDSETSANISSYVGFNTFKNDFILEGNTTRQIYSDPYNTNMILLGDANGNETTIVAKTLQWGINTVHPDNTPTVGGRMELPIKWGRNGTFLGINGGLIDDISFKKHKQNLENNLNVEFLSPSQTENGFYVETGWTSIGNKIKVPAKDSIWKT